MKYLKKITLSLLTFVFVFLMVGQTYKVEASEEVPSYWTLESDGYYYLENEMFGTTKGAYPFTIESHNGNPIIGYNDYGNIVLFDYKTEFYVDELDTNDDISFDFIMYSGENGTNGVFSILGFIPSTIKYKAEAYNSNNPGDLSLLGFEENEYHIIPITYEEYYSSLNKYYIPATFNMSLFNIREEKFVKYLLKHFYSPQKYHNTGINYDLDNATFFTISNDEYYYFKIITGELIINSINSFNELPNTIGNFENGLNDVGFVYIEKINTSIYNIKVYYKEFIYSLNVNNVPEHIFNSKKVYYFTDSGQRYFIGFYEYQNHYKDTSSIEQNLIDNSWIYWNLNNGEFMRSEINVIRGLIHNNSGTMLFTDIVIPHNIDDLLSIVVEFDYQYKYLNGSVGAWQKVTGKYLNNDVKTYIQVPWYASPLGFYNFIIKKTNLFTQNEISKPETTTEYKEIYVEKFNSYNEKLGLPNNYTVSTLFPNNSSVYRLYLGSYNKWWATGLNVKDFGIAAYRYVYNGVEYSNPYPETHIPDYEHENTQIENFFERFLKFFDGVWAAFLKFFYIGIAVVAIFSYPIVFKLLQGVFGNKIKKQRTLIFIIYLGILYLAWFLLIR